MELGLPAAPPVPSEAWLEIRLFSTPQIKVVLVCSTTVGALGQGGTFCRRLQNGMEFIVVSNAMVFGGTGAVGYQVAK
jgi:hypothetical protein